MAGKSKEEEINTRQKERAQIVFRLTDTQTAEKEEIIGKCASRKPLAGDCRLQARWLMLLISVLGFNARLLSSILLTTFPLMTKLK